MTRNNKGRRTRWEDEIAAMKDLEEWEQVDPGEELKELPRIKNLNPHRSPRKLAPNHIPKVAEEEVLTNLADEDDIVTFTYNVQRDSHERTWLKNSLKDMLQLGWISDVLRPVKGGKEASVYLCQGTALTDQAFVAAKIYRPRMFRNLRNDHIYREGRSQLDSDGLQIIDEGMLKAIELKSGYGKQLMHASWIEYEFKTMQRLYELGADVPQPYARGDNVILMRYLGSQTIPAPTLNSVDLEEDEVIMLFERCIWNLELMLANDIVHGDYSAYNILYWEGTIWVIDFPQVINPKENRSGYIIFKRDVNRICEYFQAQGVKVNPNRIAEALWRKYDHRSDPVADPKYLDPWDEDDLSYWEQYRE